MTNRSTLMQLSTVGLAARIKALASYSVPEIYKWLREKATTGEPEPADQDMVNHPPHYAGDIECIDAMVQQFSAKEVAVYCKINAFKYLWRTNMKNGREDVEKAEWYLKKHLSLSEPDNP